MVWSVADGFVAATRCNSRTIAFVPEAEHSACTHQLQLTYKLVQSDFQ